MEHLRAAYSVAQSLFEAVQNPALQEMCSVWGYESELESLQGTVDTIKAMLLDAESQQDRGEVLTHQLQLWVEQLKDAIYDADDLLDTFVTLAEQKQQRDNDTEGVSLFKKAVLAPCTDDAARTPGKTGQAFNTSLTLIFNETTMLPPMKTWKRNLMETQKWNRMETQKPNLRETHERKIPMISPKWLDVNVRLFRNPELFDVEYGGWWLKCREV